MNAYAESISRRAGRSIGAPWAIGLALGLVLSAAACGNPDADKSSSDDPSSSDPDVALQSQGSDPGAEEIEDTGQSGAPDSSADGIAGAEQTLPEPILDESGPAGPTDMSEDAFLAAYAELEGIASLESGLMYRVVSEGTGASPSINDRVRVSYRGTLMNGEVFDETASGESATFHVGSLIRGWQEALPLMREGAVWELIVPSYLAYGEKGTDDGTIGPSQPLIFEITLHEIVQT